MCFALEVGVCFVLRFLLQFFLPIRGNRKCERGMNIMDQGIGTAEKTVYIKTSCLGEKNLG